MGLGKLKELNVSLMVCVRFVVVLLSMVFVPTLAAQPPRERDPFFLALRDVHQQRSSDRELYETLLKFKNVETEIGLGAEDREQIKELIRDSIRKTMDLRDELKDAELSTQELFAKINDVQAPFDQKITDLLQKANFDRLLAIYVQDKAARAVTNTAVAEKIGLSTEQVGELRAYRSKLWGNLMDENREQVRNLIRQGKREQITTLFKTAEEKLNQAMAAKLTEGQRQTLEAMKGEKFEFEELERGGRGPAPGGGRRGKDKECCKP